MNPVLVTMFVLIKFLVKQCKDKNFLLQVHFIYWLMVERKAAVNSSAAPGKGA
jgi:hypothetical protein